MRNRIRIYRSILISLCIFGIHTIAHGQCCTVPSVETSAIAGYSNGPQTVTGNFEMTISDAGSDNFADRKIQEVENSPGVDSCYFPDNSASLTPESNFTPSPPWTVGSNNQYGLDAVGLSLNLVAYLYSVAYPHTSYGEHLPCGFTYPTSMGISSCVQGDGNIRYSTHTASISLGTQYIVSCRQSTSGCVNISVTPSD